MDFCSILHGLQIAEYSAIEKIVEKYGKDAHKYVEEYVKEMVEAIK